MAYEIISDVFSSLRQFVGIIALCLAMVGFMTVLRKIGEQNISSKCRKYSYFLLIIGIMFTLNDMANLIMNIFIPYTATALSEENLPIEVIYVILNIITLVISIPVFLTVRKSCKAIYEMLLKVQEVK